MSNRRKPSAVPSLDRLTDQRIPGGCADCDAYQTVDRKSDRIFLMVVHHDASCPYYRRATR